MEKFNDQSQQAKQASTKLDQSNQAEEVVEFKSTSPEIPQDVEFTADQKLEDKIEDNLETER